MSSKRNGNAEKYNLVEECTVPSPTMQRSRNKRQSRYSRKFICIIGYLTLFFD